MSYLQCSDIRQLFPRKLALHMRERKKKYPSAGGPAGKVESAGEGGKDQKESSRGDQGLPEIKVTWALPSLESFSFF